VPRLQAAGDEVIDVEQRPGGVLHLVLGTDGHLGQDVAGSVDQTPLPQRAAEHGLGGVDQPAGAVGDDQQRWGEAAGGELVEEVVPGVGGLAGASPSATKTALPSVVIPQAASTGSARAPGCILKCDASRNR
jgi:hypothetical protein